MSTNPSHSHRYTSIFSTNLTRLHDPNLKSFQDFCLFDHPDLLALRETDRPLFKVYLTRLEPRVRVYSDESFHNEVACSQEVSECILTEIYLYDTRHLEQIMCVGIGRYPHNLLRPFVGDDLVSYYAEPEVQDPDAICAQISRDHGLVFIDENSKLFFRDFGTKKKGQRSGSKNGTWVNGREPIQDYIIPWREGDYLGVGGRVWVQGETELRKEHYFKLRFEKVDPQEPWIKPV